MNKPYWLHIGLIRPFYNLDYINQLMPKYIRVTEVAGLVGMNRWVNTNDLMNTIAMRADDGISGTELMTLGLSNIPKSRKTMCPYMENAYKKVPEFTEADKVYFRNTYGVEWHDMFLDTPMYLKQVKDNATNNSPSIMSQIWNWITGNKTLTADEKWMALYELKLDIRYWVDDNFEHGSAEWKQYCLPLGSYTELIMLHNRDGEQQKRLAKIIPGTDYLLVGDMDLYEGTCITEFKTRQKQLKNVAQYEKCQIQMYAWMCEEAETVVLEQHCYERAERENFSARYLRREARSTIKMLTEVCNRIDTILGDSSEYDSEYSSEDISEDRSNTTSIDIRAMMGM